MDNSRQISFSMTMNFYCHFRNLEIEDYYYIDKKYTEQELKSDSKMNVVGYFASLSRTSSSLFNWNEKSA